MTTLDDWAATLQLHPHEIAEFTNWWNERPTTVHDIPLPQGPPAPDPGPIKITGTDLTTFLAVLFIAFNGPHHPHTIHVWINENAAKFKINNGTWSPPLGHPDD